MSTLTRTKIRLGLAYIVVAFLLVTFIASALNVPNDNRIGTQNQEPPPSALTPWQWGLTAAGIVALLYGIPLLLSATPRLRRHNH